MRISVSKAGLHPVLIFYCLNWKIVPQIIVKMFNALVDAIIAATEI